MTPRSENWCNWTGFLVKSTVYSSVYSWLELPLGRRRGLGALIAHPTSPELAPSAGAQSAEEVTGRHKELQLLVRIINAVDLRRLHLAPHVVRRRCPDAGAEFEKGPVD